MNVCVPVLRRYDLLRRLLVSLAASDVQPDAVYVLDNGRDAEKVNEAVDGFDFPIIVETPEQNLGVAGSWNWFIQNVPADEWLITNDDIVFAPQTIDRMQETGGDLVFGFGFSCFLIRRSCVEKLGLFDETISPNYAYYEDIDYTERAHAKGLRGCLVDAQDTGLVHGDGKDASCTWRAGTPEEIQDHNRRFALAGQNFVRKWGAAPQVLEAQRVRRVELATGAKPRLLWVGDACCPSGFAKATHEILETLRKEYDVTVLGINYNGDPYPYPYPVYAASVHCVDGIGVGRIEWMCDRVQPDVIVLQNDGFNIPYYMEALRVKHAHVPVVAAVAVDGKNFRGEWLNGISLAIFWTQFGLDEARAGGYRGPAQVIPLGVDLNTYYPMDKIEARKACGWKEGEGFRGFTYERSFIVGNVNRNQVRKRWDLTIRYFAEWVRRRKPENAWLFLHTAPTGDDGIDARQLMSYYGKGISGGLNLAIVQPPTFYGNSEEHMRATYCAMDVDVTTSQGEGFGLTTIEAMACGVPCILPEHSAFGQGGWVNGAAAFVPCTSSAINPNGGLNIVGGVPDEEQFIDVLDMLYRHPSLRRDKRNAGLALAHEQRFRWQAIGQEYAKTIGHLLGSVEEARQEAMA
jgi:glycosyltransferase involved in cell wall biosynthesis